MQTDLIAQSWDGLAGRRRETIEHFYGRLFERHPRYRTLFADDLGAQAERMVEMVGAVARFADHLDLVTPYLQHVGDAHRRLGIGESDLENFQAALVDTLAEHAPGWSEAHRAAWNEVFEEAIVPIIAQRLRR